MIGIDAMKNIYFALLVAVTLILAGCSTHITGEYINKHSEISDQVRGMTLDAALAIVKLRFDRSFDDSRFQMPETSSMRLISVNEAGIVYAYSRRYSYVGKTNYSTMRQEILTESSSGRRQFKFADVTAMRISPGPTHRRHILNNSQLELLNNKGMYICDFEVGDLSNKDINQLIAALYFLCPNMQTK